MRIHYIQHVPFEGPASIAKWADTRGHSMTATHVYQNQSFPNLKAFDWLIIMGGPMSIYDEEKYAWLGKEKAIVKQSIDSGKTVIGICLGAQLIADVLGADVYPNEYKEIGWHPIELTPEGTASELFGFLPARFTAFHWHGDTFSIPDGAVHLSKSEGCENQAFVYDSRVLGLQFHLESTRESVGALIENCRSEVISDKFIQSFDVLLSHPDDGFRQLNDGMFGILDRLPNARSNDS